MEQEKALELVKKGATLLCLDVPQYTLFGIDTQMFTVGPNFKGIKMIPPGPHFVYYSSSNKDGNAFSPVVGFFVITSPSLVIVRKWVQQEESLVRLSDEEEEERYCMGVKNMEMDRYLGPYDLKKFNEWKRISNYITKSTIERIQPVGGDITVSSESGFVSSAPRTTMEMALAEQLKNSKFSEEASGKSIVRGCCYTSIPHVVKQKGVVGQDLTSLNLDKTQLLETLLLKEYGGSEDLLLGELQFSYIAFLMGQSLVSFFQWKDLVTLLFGCTEAPFRTRSLLFTKFIKVIYYQLKFGFQKDDGSASGGEKGASLFLDDSWLSKDSFLLHLCKNFFSLVQEASVIDGDLLSWTRKLEQLLLTTSGWDFTHDGAVDDLYDEDDEFAPVVVMLDETSI
ncbi:hypothetical protein MKW98_004325 [Papaver atlanticum]|uniref:Protein AAR2 homolog n=1 Tax=Papaver atlanticum TaxID=357466 RepID=A0AAD4XHS1_9MAGN|nr:hypothetical protein MKW98_004325 [Papaver atlanticum]